MEKNIKSNPGIQFPQSQYGFYQKLVPIDGGIELVKNLIASKTYEATFLQHHQLEILFPILKKESG